jgi:hypothetical protein
LAAKLSDLGFSKGIIVETIVTTYNDDEGSNAAPMGTTMLNEQQLAIDFFNSSSTFRNVKARKCAVVNLTFNIDVFYKTAFKETNPYCKLPQEWFVPSKVVNAPNLILADATIDATVGELTPIAAQRTRALLNVQRLSAKQEYPKVYCRAFGATVEAIIHATRVKTFVNDEKKHMNVSKLLQMIDNCNDVVNRVAPDSAYSAVMVDLTKRVNSWLVRK